MGNKREYAIKYQKKYRNTPIGRAFYILNNYNNKDLKLGRGKGDLTAEWIVENIFTQPCAHCGKTGWNVIGCNRLNNDLPHTKDNVEPCCKECNDNLNYKDRREKVFQYTLDGKFVKEWESASECGKYGFMQSHVSECLKGVKKQYRGFLWLKNKMGLTSPS